MRVTGVVSAATATADRAHECPFGVSCIIVLRSVNAQYSCEQEILLPSLPSKRGKVVPLRQKRQQQEVGAAFGWRGVAAA